MPLMRPIYEQVTVEYFLHICGDHMHMYIFACLDGLCSFMLWCCSHPDSLYKVKKNKLLGWKCLPNSSQQSFTGIFTCLGSFFVFFFFFGNCKLGTSH